MSLKSRLILRLAVSLIVALAVVFIPAGTLRFWRGWVLLAIFYTYASWAFAYFYRHDRALIERRLRSQEKIREERWLVRLLMPAFLAGFVLPGFDYRLGWSRAVLGVVAPAWLSLIADALILCSLVFLFWVFRVNSFASRTIEVVAGQKVISSGPYGWVRHPLYAASLVMWLSVPLALGSYVTWPAFALLIPFYVLRLLNEERLLRCELPGYSEYCQRTRFRVVPHVW